MSRTLPVVIRNDAKNWSLYDKLIAWNLKERASQDKELNRTFTNFQGQP